MWYFYSEVEVMRRSIVIIVVTVLISVVYSCGKGGSASMAERSGKNYAKVLQQEDGTIALNIEKAATYKDKNDPSGNTAEWNFVVSKAGRYDVWLSSACKDTMHLNYSGSVIISLLDERLSVKPVGNKIITNTPDVKYPYFRADSYMGSFYIQEPGEYFIQVISDKAVPVAESGNNAEETNSTKLMSVILTPLTR
jgi:hypothetical protein